jgi:hypothetical protein
MKMIARALVILAAFYGLTSSAHAVCTVTGVLNVTPTTLNGGTYTATTIPATTTMGLNFVLSVSTTGGVCHASISLQRISSGPAQLNRIIPSTVGLPYKMQSGGLNVLYLSGGTPARVLLPSFTPAIGATSATVSTSVDFIPQTPLSAPMAGPHADVLSLEVWNVPAIGTPVKIGSTQFNITATVLGSCTLSAPSSMTLNFTSDVTTGTPAGVAQTASFNVNCTSPTKLRLSGSALVRTPAGTGTAVFDAIINYRAVATFGGTTTTLVTAGTSPITITSPTPSTITGTNLPVGLNVKLIAAKPLLRGNYSSVLRVIVDPLL